MYHNIIWYIFHIDDLSIKVKHVSIQMLIHTHFRDTRRSFPGSCVWDKWVQRAQVHRLPAMHQASRGDNTERRFSYTPSRPVPGFVTLGSLISFCLIFLI